MSIGAALRWPAVFVIGIAMVACAGLGGPPSEPPRVSLADVGIEEFGLLEQKLRLVLRVQNPNDVAIGIVGLSYELEVNGSRLAQGVSDQTLRVPRFGEATLTVGAVTGLAGLLRQLDDLRRGGRPAIAYRIHGRLSLDGGGSVPFDHHGEVVLPALPGERSKRL